MGLIGLFDLLAGLDPNPNAPKRFTILIIEMLTETLSNDVIKVRG